MKQFLTPLAAAAALLLPIAANAGTLTLNQPTTMRIGTGTGNPPYTAQQVSPEYARITGSGFSQTPPAQMMFNGTFNANPSDVFSLLYGITIQFDNWTSSGSYQLNLFATPSSTGNEFSVGSTSGTFGQGPNSVLVNGMFQTILAAGTGTYRGELIVNYTGPGLPRAGGLDGTPPPTVTITLDTFDLRIEPIPEPSTYALLGLGAAGMAYIARRRRKS
jgi:hypothetical protein